MRQLISLQSSEGDHDDATNTHRWMISYADFITLLFVLFLALYARLPKKPEPETPSTAAMQTTKKTVAPARGRPVVAPARLEPLLDVIQPASPPAPPATPFTASADPTLIGSSLPASPTLDVRLLPPSQQDTVTPLLPPISLPAESTPTAVQVQKQLLLDRLAHDLGDLVDRGDVSLISRPEGVLLEIRDTALFASGTAQPAHTARDILLRVAAIIRPEPNLVVVEGHTDNLPIQTTQYPSNWELSSARAAAVVRELQDQGVSAERLTAAGLADTKPRTSNETSAGRGANRRVTLLVLNAGRTD